MIRDAKINEYNLNELLGKFKHYQKSGFMVMQTSKVEIKLMIKVIEQALKEKGIK